MAELLQYNFEVVGTANVERALASLERRFAQHNAKMAREFGGRPGGGGGSARAPGGVRAGTEGMAGAAAVREQTAMLKKLERDQIASAKRVERERIASEKAVAREQQKQENYWAKARQNARHADAEALKLQAAARADFVKSTIGKGAGRVLNGVKAVGAAGLAMTGIGGAALAASSVSQALDLDERARRLSIAARGKGEAGADPASLRKAFTATGIKYGLAPEDVAAGVQSYVSDTGDLGTAMANRDTFAAVAQGEDAKMPEVFSTASALTQSMDIKTVKEMADSFAILATQGKKGSFEIRNMAQYLPQVLATASSAGVKGTRGVRDVGAFMQMGMRATHDAAETATSSDAMFRQLHAKAGKMASGEAFGGNKVHVYEKDDPTKNMLPFADVVQNAISASRGNVGQLNETFDVRGVRNLMPMITAYKDANNAAGGGKKGDDAGRAAMKGMFEGFSEVQASFSEIERDATDAMKSTNVQLEILSADLKDVVASELFPDFIALAKELPAIIGPVKSITHALVKLAELIIDHPLGSLGTVLAAAVAAEVLKAQLGKVLEGAVSGLTGGGYTGPKLGGPTTASGVIGAAGTGLATGVAVATAIFTAGVVNFENAEVNMKTAGDDLNKVRGAGVGDIDMVQKTVLSTTKKLAELENPGYGAQAANLISYGSTTDDTQIATTKTFLAEEVAKLHELQSQVAKEQLAAAKELTAAAGALKASGSGPGGPPNRGNSPSPVKP